MLHCLIPGDLLAGTQWSQGCNPLRRVHLSPGSCKTAMCHWVTFHRQHPTQEYVLDYILERKSVEDLYGSIKTIRYESQKYGMRRCGLRHLMYLVEGDPNNLQDSGVHHKPTSLLCVSTMSLLQERLCLWKCSPRTSAGVALMH